MADQVIAAPSPEKNPPVLRIELRQKDIKALGNVKPGDIISLSVTGPLKSIELREPYMESSQKYVGYVEVECDKIKAAPKDNAFGEMADE